MEEGFDHQPSSSNGESEEEEEQDSDDSDDTLTNIISKLKSEGNVKRFQLCPRPLQNACKTTSVHGVFYSSCSPCSGVTQRCSLVMSKLLL